MSKGKKSTVSKAAIRAKKDALDGIFDQIFEKGLVRFLILYPIGVTGWIFSVIGAIGATTANYIVAFAVGLYFLMIFLWLTVNLWTKRRELIIEQNTSSQLREDRERLGIQFAQHLRKEPDYYSIDMWVEKIHVKENGDTWISREVKIVPGTRGIDLAFFSLYGNEPSHADTVSVKAYRVINEPGGDKTTDLDVFSVWEPGGTKLASFVLLENHFTMEETVTIRVEWNWKEYSKTLINKGAEPHHIKMSRPCKNFELLLQVNKVGTFAQGGIHALPLTTTADGRILKKCIVTSRTEENCHIVQCKVSELENDDLFAFRVEKKSE